MECDLPSVEQFRPNVFQSQSEQIATKYFLKIYLNIITSFTYDLFHRICLLRLHIQPRCTAAYYPWGRHPVFQHNLQLIYFMKVCYPEFTVETPFSSQEKWSMLWNIHIQTSCCLNEFILPTTLGLKLEYLHLFFCDSYSQCHLSGKSVLTEQKSKILMIPHYLQSTAVDTSCTAYEYHIALVETHCCITLFTSEAYWQQRVLLSNYFMRLDFF